MQAKLLVMQSSGGVFSSDAARGRPVFMVESGPGRRRDRLGAPRRDARPPGHPLLRHGRHDREGGPDPGRPPVGDEGLRRRRARRRGDRRHVPLRLPGPDAGHRPRRDRRRRRLDRLGRFGRAPARRAAERGRRSGPVCYGRGGAEPTITDANLVLGRLNPATSSAARSAS